MHPSLLLRWLEREAHKRPSSALERTVLKHFSVTEKAPVATEQTALSDREHAAVQRVADQRGITFEEAVEQMAKEGLASRVRRKTGRAPAKVYEMPPRGKS